MNPPLDRFSPDPDPVLDTTEQDITDREEREARKADRDRDREVDRND